VKDAENVKNFLDKGKEDKRTFWDYAPCLNLMQSANLLAKQARKVLNATLSFISFFGSVVLNVLKIIGVAASFFAGPIGWLVSAGLFFLSAALSAIAYWGAISNPEHTWKEMGYQCESSTEDNPLQRHKEFFKDANNQIRARNALIFQKDINESHGLKGNALPWPESLKANEKEFRNLGFDYYGQLDGKNGKIDRIYNSLLGVSLYFAFNQRTNELLVSSKVDEGYHQNMYVLGGALGCGIGSRVEAAEKAFQILASSHETTDIVFTGSGASGACNQFLALKYGCLSFLDNSYGVFPVLQSIVGEGRISRNAPLIFHFQIPERQNFFQRVFSRLDAFIAIILSYRTFGNFGNRIHLKLNGGESYVDAVERYIAACCIEGPPEEEGSAPQESS
jgi:hypothetical protein